MGTPEVLGVEQLTVDGAILRTTVKASADAQASVTRELRNRLTTALAVAGSRAGDVRWPGLPPAADGRWTRGWDEWHGRQRELGRDHRRLRRGLARHG